jgi:hypothetical protein
MVRKRQPSVVALATFLGGLAPIETVFGNPLIRIFMVMEFVAVGIAPATIFLPGLIALGAGFLVQTGLGNVPGLRVHSLRVHSLSVPGMLDYTSSQRGISSSASPSVFWQFCSFPKLTSAL